MLREHRPVLAPMRRPAAWIHGALALLLGACPGEAAVDTTGTTGTSSSTSEPGSESGSSSEPTTTPTTTPTEPGTTGPGTTGPDPTGSTSSTDTTGTGSTTDPDETTTGEPDVIPVPDVCEDMPVRPCAEEITNCKVDQDTDQVSFICDNAPDYTNPDQQDLDGDGFGDIHDKCPTIASDNNLADTDKDGVGNVCDVCPRSVSSYNQIALPIPFYMRVRNIPQQHDTDKDGIGDVCDNCVRTANCLDYGDGPGETPFVVGMPIDLDSPQCQQDVIDDNIGEACFGTTLPGAAGKVGYADADDFDQDGLANLTDACPRQPVKRRTCDADDDCVDGARCAAEGVCNHADHDDDGVGDLCDTCPDVANPEQVTEQGAKLDDPDGDFIGTACEQNAGCVERANARRFAFFDVSVGGRCCTTVYDGPILDPNGQPIAEDALGPQPAGVLDLPPGCDEALMASEDGEAHLIEWCNVADPGELYQYFCLLPSWDQDFDTIPDECDLCVFAYDPDNQIYIDANNKEWPNYGKYCTGDFDEDELDPAMMCAQGS